MLQTMDKLFIFSKDTDATEQLRGYEYQKLRSIEDWLRNYVQKNNEVVYCEYEEDIFRRNLDTWTSKFVQLKLYSSKTFSLTSIEVVKAITHFFVLFVKGEYKFDNLEFVFETNSNIARNYGTNDADLLNEWNENQNSLSPEIIEKCVAKVKSIISNYIETFDPKKNDQEQHKTIKAAKEVFNIIPQETWAEFITSIKWKFSNVSAEESMKSVIDNINSLILETNIPTSNDQRETIFTKLYYAVAEKSIATESEDRKLSIEYLDYLILDTGNEQDREYNEDFQSWNAVDQIDSFRFGEFYQVVNLSGYCRKYSFLEHHQPIWLRILKDYITLIDIPPIAKQKAIYEIVWQSVRIKDPIAPRGTLTGLESSIRDYFSRISLFPDHESLEDTLALTGIVRGAIALKFTDITSQEVEIWQRNLFNILMVALAEAKDDNAKCYLYETLAFLALMSITNLNESSVVDDAFVHLNAILSLLDRATLYNVVQLNNRIEGVISDMIQVKMNLDHISQFEDYSEQLAPYVSSKMGNNEMAQNYVRKGVNYINSDTPFSLIRGLNHFHKAKALWRNDQTNEGYVLLLLNLAQLYNAVGCNFAAKYYALTAGRISSMHTHLNKRIAKAFEFIILSDFRQGAWISCIQNFHFYIALRNEYEGLEIDINDEAFLKTCGEIGFVLALAPRVDSQVGVLIDYEIVKLGEFYNEFLIDIVSSIRNSDKVDIKELINNQLDDAPLNDLGPMRTIFWSALGINLEVKFANNFLLNSLAEEFLGTWQIVVIEILAARLDLHFLDVAVEVEIVSSTAFVPPVRLESPDSNKWKLSLPAVLDEDYNKIRLQPNVIVTNLKMILNEVSVLPKKELFDKIDSLFKDRELAAKTLPDLLYQRTFRYFLNEQEFNDYHKNNFNHVTFEFKPPVMDEFKWNNKESAKYSQEQSMKMIQGRYNNVKKAMHVTLERLQNDPRYNELIFNLRGDNWLDWQIVIALFNHILSYRVSVDLDGREFNNDGEKRQALNDSVQRLRKLDERDFPVEIPLDYFFDDSLDFQLRQLGLISLENWGLENKSSSPNLLAIHDFLVAKFHFGDDDDLSLSPL